MDPNIVGFQVVERFHFCKNVERLYTVDKMKNGSRMARSARLPKTNLAGFCL